MKTLFLHVGLPRTGTTTLQRHFFSNHPNYLGKDGNYDPAQTKTGSNKEVENLQALSRASKMLPARDVREKTKIWVSNIQNLDDEYGDSWIVSDEGLSAWDIDLPLSTPWPISYAKNNELAERKREWPHPLTNYLKNYLIPEWSPGSVKVILTLRNPETWIPSLYSHCTEALRDPCQKQFDVMVEDLTKTYCPFLDWRNLCSGLSSAVGKENLLILYQEGLSSLSYWEELSRFTKLDVPFSSLPKTNSRSHVIEGGRVFEIRPPAPLVSRRLQKNRVINTSAIARNLISVLGRAESRYRSFSLRDRGASYFSTSQDLRARLSKATSLPSS